MRFWLPLVLLVWGCTGSTYVDVFFEADPAALRDATALHIVVQSADGVTRLDETKSLGQIDLPTGVRVRPRAGSTSFTVRGELLDGAGRALAVQRAIPSFVANEGREVWLRFSAACASVTCSASETCRAGTCEQACVTPTPTGGPHPTPLHACGVGEAGVEAGPGDAAPPDGGVSEGGPLEAGPHVPSFLIRRVDAFRAVSSSYAPVTSLDVGGDGRRWMVWVTGTMTSASCCESASLRVLEDGVEKRVLESWSDNDATYLTATGGPFVYFDIVGGSAPVSVSVEAAGAGAAEGLISDLIVVAFPLPDGAVAAETTPDDATVPIDSLFHEVGSISVPAGDYLLLMLANARHAGGSAYSIELKVESPTEDWPMSSTGSGVGSARPFLANTLPDPQSFLIARHVTPNTSAVYRMAAKVPSGTDVPEVTGQHFVALALDTFADHAHCEDPAVLVTTASRDAAEPRCHLDVTPLGVQDFVVLENMAMASGATGSHRGGIFATGGGHMRTVDHARDNPDDRETYPIVDAFSASDPFTCAMWSWSPTGDPVESKESVIDVLALP